MQCRFEVGQLVVCVADKCFMCEKGVGLEVGRIYEVAEVTVHDWAGDVFVSVKEAPRSDCVLMTKWFWHECFKPAKIASIDQFRSALEPRPTAPVKEREKEDA